MRNQWHLPVLAYARDTLMEHSIGIEVHDLPAFSAIFYDLCSLSLCIDMLFLSAFILFLLFFTHTTSFLFFAKLRQPSHHSDNICNHPIVHLEDWWCPLGSIHRLILKGSNCWSWTRLLKCTSYFLVI